MSENCFCCWYKRALSMASAAWPPIAVAWSIVSLVTGVPGCTDRIVNDASTSAGVAIGPGARPPRSRKGSSAVSGAPIASAVSRVIRNGSPSETATGPDGRRTPGCVEDRACGLHEARLSYLHRSRKKPLAPFIGHADERDVNAEHIHDRARDGFQRRLQRQALRERT